jgi:hypothetical protein
MYAIRSTTVMHEIFLKELACVHTDKALAFCMGSHPRL